MSCARQEFESSRQIICLYLTRAVRGPVFLLSLPSLSYQDIDNPFTIMTSAVEPDYIRCVSVSRPRCPSVASVHSTLSVLPVSIQRNRPQTAADVAMAARGQSERILDPGRTGMLDELMFLYGRGVSNSFNFKSNRSRPSSNLPRSKTSLGFSHASPWEIDNNAALQMYRASSRLQRRRAFPQLFSQSAIRQNVTWQVLPNQRPKC